MVWICDIDFIYERLNTVCSHTAEKFYYQVKA